jgi:hypothetical protein
MVIPVAIGTITPSIEGVLEERDGRGMSTLA